MLDSFSSISPFLDKIVDFCDVDDLSSRYTQVQYLQIDAGEVGGVG